MVGRSRGAAPMSKSPRATGAENIDDRPNAAIDRRSFLASGAAVVAIAEAPAAQAAEAMAWDREVDVVVIGAGAGGLVAAIAARGKGASALIVEKNFDIGGTARMRFWGPYICGGEPGRKGQKGGGFPPPGVGRLGRARKADGRLSTNA